MGDLVELGIKARLEHPRVQELIKAHPSSHQEPGPHPFGERHDGKQKGRDEGEADQGELVLAEHHAIKHLQHVQSRRQHEHVGKEAENTHKAVKRLMTGLLVW